MVRVCLTLSIGAALASGSSNCEQHNNLHTVCGWVDNICLRNAHRHLQWYCRLTVFRLECIFHQLTGLLAGTPKQQSTNLCTRYGVVLHVCIYDDDDDRQSAIQMSLPLGAGRKLCIRGHAVRILDEWHVVCGILYTNHISNELSTAIITQQPAEICTSLWHLFCLHINMTESFKLPVNMYKP